MVENGKRDRLKGVSKNKFKRVLTNVSCCAIVCGRDIRKGDKK